VTETVEEAIVVLKQRDEEGEAGEEQA